MQVFPNGTHDGAFFRVQALTPALDSWRKQILSLAGNARLPYSEDTRSKLAAAGEQRVLLENMSEATAQAAAALAGATHGCVPAHCMPRTSHAAWTTAFGKHVSEVLVGAGSMLILCAAFLALHFPRIAYCPLGARTGSTKIF